ncbi:MAG TPA: efflux RND transporter periplasmic adaptor subunit [Anaeromyxobacter sp.]|nr:efflux RND transporter periplasmic adaptor subunit [Anaeromyxobacter sp.]
MPRRVAWWGAAAGVAAVALGLLWQASRRAPAQGQAAAGERGRPSQPPPVPVAVVPVARRDVPVYLEGLGSVVANRTVTVRSLVDGRLQEVRFQEGQRVHRGDVLAQVDPRPFQAQLDQAQGALLRDQAQLRAARINVERDQRLVAQSLIAQQQLDADQALAGQLEGSVRMDQASIETARLSLDYARITAPVDGVTGIRAVDPGNVVHATDTGGIVVVTQLDPVGVIFSLPQDDLAEISEHLARGRLAVDAWSRDGATLLGQGTLELIDNQINQATSTLRLKAILPNPRHLLWPNQFVNARLRLETRQGALVMPAAAVQRGPSGTFAWVVDARGQAAQRPVQIDLTQGEEALVASGLSEGDRVVVEGQNQLRPGARVAVRTDAAASPPVVAGGPAAPGAGSGAP